MLDRFKVPEAIAMRVAPDDVRATVEDIFGALGMPEEDARQATDVLIYADVRGIDTHGVSNMMRRYVRGFENGSINPTPRWTVVREAPGVATIDSDAGLGLVVGPAAMDLAMDKAEQCGVGTVVVTNGRHYGAAAYHASMALERDMIGLSMTTGGLRLVPTHGAKAMVGLNPLGVAAPARQEAPFIFDASMSSVAGNKIRLAQRLGKTILPGWIAGTDGTPIMEEGEAPEGGPEGVSAFPSQGSSSDWGGSGFSAD